MQLYFKRLKDLREDNDFSQLDIAQILKVRRQTYADYENGTSTIKTKHLITLSKLYKVSIDYIVGNTDIKELYPKPKKN